MRCACFRMLIAFTFAFVIGTLQAKERLACLPPALAVEQSNAYLQFFRTLPTAPFVPLQSSLRAEFVSASQVFAEVLELSPKTLIINHLDELKYLPFTLARSSVLLVIDKAENWTEAKHNKASAVAKTAAIEISLVWLGSAEVPAQLRQTITENGGHLWRLPELNKAVLDYFCLDQKELLSARF